MAYVRSLFLLATLAVLVLWSTAADRSAHAWTPAGNMATARYNHTATLLPDGRVLVAGGGADFVGALGSAELYNPAANSWSPAASLAEARQIHAATSLGNGKVLVVGGERSCSNCAISSAELYDPAANTWTSAGSMAAGRIKPTATLLTDGRVLVAGGRGLASAELYNPVANSWSSAASMAAAREVHTATLLPNGKVLVVGGGGAGILASAELYDPVANTWSPAGSLAVARYYHTATLLSGAKVLAAGGYGVAAALASAELYDPVANTWSPAASMAAARAVHTASLLSNGRVLVAGGEGGGYLASAELYDPGANTWSAGASLAGVRGYHTTTLLASGKVVAAGGQGPGTLASAEIYSDSDGDGVIDSLDNCPTSYNPNQDPNACVVPGLDYWETPPGGAAQDFSTAPVPADFFDPGSDPFTGLVCLGGDPLNLATTGTADTVIRRLGPVNLPNPLPSTDTIPIEIVQLSLVSCSPITVTYIGGPPPELWDVRVSLSPTPAPSGQMTVTKANANGGTFASQFYVQPLFTFVRVSDSSVRVLDTGAEALPPELFQPAGLEPWVHSCDPPYLPSGTNFCPGMNATNSRVLGLYTAPTAQQRLQTACFDPDLDGVGSCVDNCPNTANPSQTDTDGDGIGDACDPTPLGDIAPGLDYFETPPNGGLHDFSGTPIPADFFGPGSEPFSGTICFGGDPFDPLNFGTADTVIRRFGPANLPDPLPSIDTVPIELVQLSLVSCSPITVTSITDPPSFWDITVTLSINPPPPPGQMTVTKTHPNGGVFTSQFNVLPRFTFTEVGNPTNQRLLDFGTEGLPPTVFQSAGPAPWVFSPCDTEFVVIPPVGDNFCPGVQTFSDRVPMQYVAPNAQQTLLLACDDPDLDGVGSCVDNCPMNANPGQLDTDGDTLGDACDNDDDNDGVGDGDEVACGSDPIDVTPPLSRPERVDGVFAGVDDDGDLMMDEPLPPGASAFDCDGDGYKGSAEDHVYSYLPQTNGDQKTCQEYDLSHPNPNADIKPSLRWPSDFNKATSPLNSFNKITINDLTPFLAPVRYFGTDVGDNPGDVRWDLSPGPGLFLTDINIVDLTALIGGPSGMPPMLGGMRAFGGPVCPYGP